MFEEIEIFDLFFETLIFFKALNVKKKKRKKKKNR